MLLSSCHLTLPESVHPSRPAEPSGLGMGQLSRPGDGGAGGAARRTRITVGWVGGVGEAGVAAAERV